MSRKSKKPLPHPPVNQIVPVKAEEPESCGRCHYWRVERCMRYPPAKIPGQQIGNAAPRDGEGRLVRGLSHCTKLTPVQMVDRSNG
jgi:hypothetical protein